MPLAAALAVAHRGEGGPHALVFAVVPSATRDAILAWDGIRTACEHVAVFGRAVADARGGPYIAIIHAAGPGKVRPREAVAAYLHPCLRWDDPVPVDSGHERRAMGIATAFVDACRAQGVPGAASMTLTKPCSDLRDALVPNSDPRHGPLIPDLLLAAPGLSAAVEVMGYVDHAYQDRKHLMRSDLEAHGIRWIEDRPAEMGEAGAAEDLARKLGALARETHPAWADSGLAAARDDHLTAPKTRPSLVTPAGMRKRAEDARGWADMAAAEARGTDAARKAAARAQAATEHGRPPAVPDDHPPGHATSGRPAAGGTGAGRATGSVDTGPRTVEARARQALTAIAGTFRRKE